MSKGTRYGRDFKVETVRLVRESGRGVAEMAEELDIYVKTLYRWRQEYEREGEYALPGKRRLKPEDAEIRRLKRELEIVCQKGDILEKAISVFSRTGR